MSEAISSVGTVLNIPALFNNIIIFIGHVQLGKSFSSDFQGCMIQLEVVRYRLDRWADEVNINGPDSQPNLNPSDPQTTKLVMRILRRLKNLIDEAKTAGDRFESEEIDELDDAQPVEDRQKDMTAGRQLVSRLRTKKRFTKMKQGMQWVVYEKTRFDRLIKDMVVFMDQLEEFSPVTGAGRKSMVKQDIVDINDPDALADLAEVGEVDPVLSSVAAEQIEIKISNVGKDVIGEDGGSAQVGDIGRLRAAARRVEIYNKGDNVKAKGQGSSAMVGNKWT